MARPGGAAAGLELQVDAPHEPREPALPQRALARAARRRFAKGALVSVRNQAESSNSRR